MGIRLLVRSKVKRARVIGGFLRNSLVFKLKRQALRPRYWFNKVSVVVVDMDGTLFDGDAGHMGLKYAYPDKIDHSTMGDILYEGMLHKLSQGSMSVEETIIDGNRLLQYRGFTKKDIRKVLQEMWPALRIELIEALKDLKKNHELKIILATLSSAEFGRMANEKIRNQYGFAFDGVIGTRLSFDTKGKMTGVKEILGLKNGRVRGIPCTTKLKAIKELCKEKKWPFTMNQTVLITDSYGDIDMAKHVKTILLVPEKPTTVQAVASKYKLADKLVPTNHQLKKNLLALFQAKK
ncbi:MAG: HAD family hydrolase [archaeon]